MDELETNVHVLTLSFLSFCYSIVIYSIANTKSIFRLLIFLSYFFFLHFNVFILSLSFVKQNYRLFISAADIHILVARRDKFVAKGGGSVQR